MTKRILVVPRQAVGEAIISQSIFKILKKRYGNVEIDVLTSNNFLPLMNRMPEVRKAIAIPKKLEFRTKRDSLFALKDTLSLGLALRRESYDQAIIYFGLRRFPFILKYVAQIPIRTGYYNRHFRFTFLNDYRTYPKNTPNRSWMVTDIHLSQPRNTPFIDYKSVGPFPELIVDAKNAEACIKRLGLGTVGHEQTRVHRRTTDYGTPSNKIPILCLLCGARHASFSSKIWPYRYFCEVADYYGTRGWQIWLLGSEKEYQISEQVVKYTKKVPIHNLCGKTELIDALDLLSKAHLVIGNDTGLMHIAAAVGCFAVVIHSSFSPERIPYFTKKFRQLHYKLPCSDCECGICRYGHYRCLSEITPAMVIEAANDLIAKNSDIFCD